MCKKLLSGVAVAAALLLGTTAMAADIAFYVGQWNWDGWYDATQFADVATIIDQTGSLFKDIQQFDDDQFDEFGAWVDENTDDHEMDIIWLNGCTPSVLYPNPNWQPDGSRAEEWLDNGNMIINVGDWFAYCTYEGGERRPENNEMGAANILDLAPSIIASGGQGVMAVTPTGREFLPSLNAVTSDRPVLLSAVVDPWEVAAIFAQNSAGTHADPVVIHNRETDGYLAIISQSASGNWIADRGLTCAEFIGNWVNEVVGLGGNPYATHPGPKDGAMHFETWITISWSPSDFAASHDIYFGENFEDVDNGTGNTFRGNQISTTFNVGEPGFPYPDGLEPSVAYYWRIDEVEADGTIHKGDVWSFTIAPQKATGPVPADGAKFVDYGVTLSWIPGLGGVLHDVYFGGNFNDVNDGTGGTFRGYTRETQFDIGFSGTPYPQGLAPGKNYYWRVDEVEADGQTTHKGDVWSFTTARTGGGLKAQYYKGVNFENLVLTRIDPQIDFNWGDPGGPDTSVGNDQFSARWTGEVKVAFTETYTFYTSTDDGVRLWIDGRQLVDAWIDQGTTEYSGKIDLVAGNTYSLIMEYYENGGGAVAELRWSSPSTPKQLIPQAALAVSFSAYEPSPADGAIDVRNKPILRWTPGGGALQHDVYLGTHFGDVNDADIFHETGIYRGRWDDASYAVEKLNIGQTYFWRIDEYNTDGTLDKGGVWRFTVGDAVEETAEYQVSSGQDDGYATGMSLQNLNSEYMKIGTTTFGNYTSGMVFRNVDISQGSDIISANLKIQSHNNRLSDVVYGTIQAEATDDSAGFGDTGSIGSLPKTNASVDWDLSEPWSADTWYTSPDISSVIQEVINRGGWSEGNSLAIIYSTKNNEGGYRQFSSFDRGSAYAPILEITYIP